MKMLAAPSFTEEGGGIAHVSRLLWHAMATQWPGECEQLTLHPSGLGAPTLEEKIRFGGVIAARQAVGRPDWILFTHLGLARAMRGVPKAMRSPYAIFLHGVECWGPLPVADIKLLAGARLRLANSAYTAQRAIAANPEIGDIVPCPLGLSVSQPVPPVTSGPREPIVLVVGRMEATERYKGHDELIDAWTAVLARVPGATLVIVGDGTDRRRLQARAAVFGDRVIFTGFIGRESLESWYARAAAFALPSRGEGFGVVYLEAMSHGVPCVGSLQDAARDVIRDGETGFLVDQSDRDALSGALVRVLEDRDLAARMGAAGRRSVLEGFTFDHFVRRFAALAHAGLERRERPALHGDRSA